MDETEGRDGLCFFVILSAAYLYGMERKDWMNGEGKGGKCVFLPELRL